MITLIIKKNKYKISKKMDILTLVITIIGSLISLVVDIYFIILYTHK